ncbi:MAG: hypothetical protein J7M38_13075, partial [Armatimonadetes bacterium]|nr:hypothetical protein [Armatimonadota bacterium]
MMNLRAAIRMPVRPALLALAAVMLGGGVCQAAKVAWRDNFEDALKHAREADKPILVFVHMGPMDRSADPADRGLDAYEQMATETFTDPNVVAATEMFECFELDLRRRENDQLRDKLRVAPVVDMATGQPTVTGIYPITLFLDSSGAERFRLHGYLPPIAYVIQLKNARTLIECQRAVERHPDDPVARRNLGRIYMEMYTEPGDKFYQAALENLEKAIKLDPDNATGANYDARVDLTIFHLPDDPQKAFNELFQLQTEDVGRRFEIQYYMGVAQYAAGNSQAAIQLLSSFET